MNRPAIVLSIENGVAHGSVRTVGDFHVLDALAECGELFEQFGGHAAAAGLKIQSGRIDELRTRLNETARRILGDVASERVLDVDAVVSPGTLCLEMLDQLACLEP